MSVGPRVVALGGGHGTAVTLRALRLYAGQITAIVSTADDGGSSGRLRDLLGVPALGDLRKCLVALAGDSWSDPGLLSTRYEEGVLEGHAMGNLLLAGLVAEAGGLEGGVAEAGKLLRVVGSVIPATTVPTELRAELLEGEMVGQAAIGRHLSVHEVSILPEGARPPDAALEAIDEADQIVIGPGSLYTSVLAAAAVPGITEALRTARARTIYVCNLRAEEPETAGYTVEDHEAALLRHRVEVDVIVYDPAGGLALGEPQMAVVEADLRGSNGLVHEPGKLARVLRDLR